MKNGNFTNSDMMEIQWGSLIEEWTGIEVGKKRPQV